MKVIIIIIIQIQLHNLNYLSRLLYFFLSHGISLHKQQKKRWTQNNSFVHATWLLIRLLWLVETKLKNRKVNHLLTLFFYFEIVGYMYITTYIHRSLTIFQNLLLRQKRHKVHSKRGDTGSLVAFTSKYVWLDLISSKHVTLLL